MAIAGLAFSPTSPELGGDITVTGSGCLPGENVLVTTYMTTGGGSTYRDVIAPAAGDGSFSIDTRVHGLPGDIPAVAGGDQFGVAAYCGGVATADPDLFQITFGFLAIPAGAPVAVFDSVSTPGGTAVEIDVLANDTGDAPTIVGKRDGSDGVVTIAPDAMSVTYTPDPGFLGTDLFEYTIEDSSGLAANAFVEVTVINTAPVANNDTYATPVDTPLVVTPPGILANDTDANGDALTIFALSDPSNGTLTATPDGGFTYTPDPGFSGADSFTYDAFDGTDDSENATVTVTVGAPTADTDSGSTRIDATAPVNVDVLANDTGDAIVVTAVTNPVNGTATIAVGGGSIDYLPDPGFFGRDDFDYTIEDSVGRTATAEVRMQVLPPLPVAVDDIANTTPDTPVTITALDNDTGLNLILWASTSPVNGTVVMAGDRQSFLYTPDPGFEGTDTFGYEMTHGVGEFSSANITVTVAAARMVANDDSALTLEDTPQTIDVLANDIGTGITVTAADDTLWGTTTIAPDGLSIIYTPNPGFVGGDIFTYTITDTAGDMDRADVTMNVLPACVFGLCGPVDPPGPGGPGDVDPGDLDPVSDEVSAAVDQVEQSVATLPNTGATSAWIAALSLLCVSVGVALVGMARRRRTG